MVANAELGVDGVPPLFLLCMVHSDVGGWFCLGPWMLGRLPRRVVHMVGPPAGNIALVVAMPPGRVGVKGVVVGASGLLVFIGRSAAHIRV